ncbi:hypothetical protein [Holdemanella porci]|jgi:transcriptional regulator with XRE-family HTH domain|uniref:hypothetical protein n=1 Tax=Holdemanella porci TaxID=2652276 RepID=UPI00242A4E3A|nr:hypothetical protein [Holdemanella porci]MDD6452954.1 hypothetical protein [Holdemanella porci]
MVDEKKTKYINDHFGPRLKFGLNYFSISIVNFAKQVGLSRGALYKYFDQKMYPTFQMVVTISNSMNIPLDYFCEDEFELNDSIFIWNEKDEFEKKDLKLKELNSDYVDSAGNRITNDDYDELELIAAKIQNRKSLKFIIDFINESMTAVDEPTKQMIINVLKKDMDEISDIVHEYQSYKKK